MSTKTDWGHVPSTDFDIIKPGGFTDSDGFQNSEYAIRMGTFLIQGSIEEWEWFSDQLVDKIHDIKYPLRFSSEVSTEVREQLNVLYREAQEAAIDDGKGKPDSPQDRLIKALMEHAGVWPVSVLS